MCQLLREIACVARGFLALVVRIGIDVLMFRVQMEDIVMEPRDSAHAHLDGLDPVVMFQRVPTMAFLAQSRMPVFVNEVGRVQIVLNAPFRVRQRPME